MAEAATNPLPVEPHHLGFRLPRPIGIGLVTLAIVVVGVGLRIGLPMYRQHLAIRETEGVGGEIWGARPVGPVWFREWAGSRFTDLVDEVDTVYIQTAEFTDDGLSKLTGFTTLRQLNLPGTRVTDAGAALLQRFARLERLGMASTAITDAGLKHLVGLSRLKEIGLKGTLVTDMGAASLNRDLPEVTVWRDQGAYR